MYNGLYYVHSSDGNGWGGGFTRVNSWFQGAGERGVGTGNGYGQPWPPFPRGLQAMGNNETYRQPADQVGDGRYDED